LLFFVVVVAVFMGTSHAANRAAGFRCTIEAELNPANLPSNVTSAPLTYVAAHTTRLATKVE
jgi:hypothetical protein